MSLNKNLEDDSNQNPRVTWEGCSVLLDVNDGDRLVFARLTAASTLSIGNKKCSLQPLIGCPFGSLFQVENGKDGPYLSRILPTTTEGDNVQKKVYCQIEDESKDNRALVDNNTAQNLTGEDIDAMRRQGATGDEIVQALIANSATFEKKTSFSQEKYRLKKQKKYAPKVLLRRPFTRRYLRVDTLSLLLSMGNVSPHSDVLVLDMVGGILTGAVAERLGGTGIVCNVYLGVTPYPIDIVRMFNFSSETCRRIVRCALTDLCSSHNGTLVQICQPEEVCNFESQSKVRNAWFRCLLSFGFLIISLDHFVQEEKSPLCSISMDETVLSSENGMLDLVPEPSISPAAKACKNTKAGEKASQEAIKLWKENGFSSLIIAAPDVDAWSIVKELLPFLSFSAPFVIYHQYIQPLATCMHNLQLGKMAVGLQISEPWLREYQVLPSRTHPLMQMSAFGGYILSGTKICIDDQR
ncbi:eukaryotic initiation factor 3 gamma subunit family protein [Actinidia rufa]|uniref:tRNA (adenine(58)-N(1))-methyltransferase non-catalytic subunit TRM6 n=1 Tax=Actinidia rufa TaxID=165716 RepID=A0A7J0GHZ8_9ERIC|nr:eukaryotic initiation factor 3 gamma subunit family protein [Actinidia rufa]